MDKKINNNFSGIINFPDSEKELSAFFHVNGNMVSLIPCTNECRSKLYYNARVYSREENEEGDWYYGYTEGGHSIAFLNPASFGFSITSPVNLGTARFHCPVILQSASSTFEKLDTFDIIEFSGGIIDLLYMPNVALNQKYSKNIIEFKSQETYTKKYEVNVNGDIFNIIYTTNARNYVMETGKIPDLRKNIHSIFKFEFPTAQSVNKFEEYYTYALRFFQFCSGCQNVSFDVRLYKNNTKPFGTTILTRIFDGFDDFANDKINFSQVINLKQLKDKLPELFKILNESQTEPYMNFLPDRNKNNGLIHYTAVTDICVSLECEFEYIKNEVIEEDRKQAKALAHSLNIQIDSSNCSDYVKQKAKNLIIGNLSNLNPSLREKIEALYDEFSKTIKWFNDLKLRSNDKPLSEDEFKKLIKKFIDIRNHVSHAGIVWNEGINIYHHLELIVYLSVLKRAGYLPEESQIILKNLFLRKFL